MALHLSAGEARRSDELGDTLLGEGHGTQRLAGRHGARRGALHSDELGGCSARSDYTLLGAVGSSEDK